MQPHWKSALHEYVNTHNQMEMNYSIDSILPILSDEKYIYMQQKRLLKIKEWHAARGVSPKKSETRIKVLRVQENQQDVVIDLALKLQSSYMLKQKQYDEDRIERERVTFVRKGEGWSINKIEVQQQEKLSTPHHLDSPLKSKHKSIPYLNPYLLSGSENNFRNIKYDRLKVQQYAETWWDQANPEYIHFDVDCTNYVSQCLYAGNAPMNYTGKRDKGWWYRGETNQEQWSFSWSVSHSLQWFLSTSTSNLRADLVQSAEQLAIGDVIIYDWDGNSKYQHSTIVVAKDASGMPLVNAHTANSRHRYWDYRDSYAWSEKTNYRFFHIHDSL